MNRKRRSARKPWVQEIRYSVSVLEFKELKRLNLSGDVVDISEEGLGIQTHYPIEPGHVLTFSNGIDHEAGIVRWSTIVKDDIYRAGVEFV
jgi:hypothetical protein